MFNGAGGQFWKTLHLEAKRGFIQVCKQRRLLELIMLPAPVLLQVDALFYNMYVLVIFLYDPWKSNCEFSAQIFQKYVKAKKS